MKKTQTMLRATGALFVAALMGPLAPQTAVAQRVYKCKAADGSTVFQQQACEPGQGGAIHVAPNVVDNSGLRNQAARMEAQRGKALDSSGLIVSGMTADEVRQRLGNPEAVNTQRGEYGERQQLVYRYPDGSTRYVYTRDGRVTTVQESSGRPRGGSNPCYSDLEIRNAMVSARALDLSQADRAEALRRVDRMRDCRR